MKGGFGARLATMMGALIALSGFGQEHKIPEKFPVTDMVRIRTTVLIRSIKPWQGRFPIAMRDQTAGLDITLSVHWVCN